VTPRRRRADVGVVLVTLGLASLAGGRRAAPRPAPAFDALSLGEPFGLRRVIASAVVVAGVALPNF
jgi:drug/metabolite transporter (DMT)-like permease